MGSTDAAPLVGVTSYTPAGNDIANNTPNDQPLARVVNLLDPSHNVIFGMSHEQATEIVAAGDPDAVRKINGHFALVGIRETNVRMARTIGKLMRYLIAKRVDGPELIVADRIDAIRDWLIDNGLADQFHPSYTRMVPD